MATPESLGDLAESLVPVATQLVGAVHDDGAGAVARVLCGIHPDHLPALAVVLAACVDPDSTLDELLGWVTWDESPAHFQPSLLMTVPSGQAKPVSTDDGHLSFAPDEWSDDECRARHSRHRSRNSAGRPDEYLDRLGYLEWERRRKRRERRANMGIVAG